MTFPEIFSILMKLVIFQISQKLPKIFHVFSNGMMKSGKLEIISENLKSVREMRRNYEKYGRGRIKKTIENKRFEKTPENIRNSEKVPGNSG